MTKLALNIVSDIWRGAPAVGIEPAALLAVVDVETGGRPYESADLDPSDGIEPAILFERHIFLRELTKLAPGLVAEARRQGLVVNRWQGPGSAQYADQKTSAGRLALLAKAVALHPEAAYRSVSMGLFQVCGFNATAAGYASAEDMHHRLTMGGLEAHIACGVAFMRSKGLLRALQARDWKAFAKGYNGTAYRKNEYDTKLAAAYAMWSTKLRSTPAAVASVSTDTLDLKLGSKGPRVRALQEALAAFGVPTKADGAFGPSTRRAVAAAQVELGLTGDGVATPAFVQTLEGADPIAHGARSVATKKEVKEASFAARAGDNLKKVGATGLGAVGVYQGYAATVQDGVDQLRSAKESVAGIVGDGFQATVTAWFVEHWQAVLMAGGCAGAIVLGGSLVGSAVRAYRSGRLVA